MINDDFSINSLKAKVKALEIEVGFVRKSNEQLEVLHREEIFRLNDKCVAMTRRLKQLMVRHRICVKCGKQLCAIEYENLHCCNAEKEE